MTMAKERKYISEPDPWGFHVKIIRSKEKYVKYFSHIQWGGKRKSLAAAKSWRDQLLAILGPPDRYLIDRPAGPDNLSTGVRGVFKQITYHKKYDFESLAYTVCWKFNGETKSKSFYVGKLGNFTTSEELHAFRTAVKFRQEYELYKFNGLRFDISRFNDWKNNVVY